MATQADHVAKATALLEEAQKYSRSTPVRLSILVEAQVHATLAQSGSTVVNVAAPASPAPKAAGARSGRRKAAEKPADDVVPGSEEDLIRQEAGK